MTDSDRQIRGFVEKPTWERVVTDLVSTGIYAISPRAMDYVPDDTACDFARELFPRLLKRGEKLCGIEVPGYWRDIGSPLSYYRACIDALEARLHITPGAAFSAAITTPPAEPSYTARPLPHIEQYDDGGELICPCRDRAAVMRTLSEALLDYGADYSDGLTLSRAGYRLHIAPMSDTNALRVSVTSPDAELAHSLALSTAEVLDVLNG